VFIVALVSNATVLIVFAAADNNVSSLCVHADLRSSLYLRHTRVAFWLYTSGAQSNATSKCRLDLF